ncbi:MAG: hypothetical protein QM778_11635 [Myxococcales bacterium]
MQTTLATLRDIEGVLGSFLIDEGGQLMARDMPGVFDDATLNSASLRLSRLRGALESESPSFGGCVARFGEHLLVVRPVAKRLLCVLVPKGANLTALQMGTNLVTRRLAQETAQTFDIPPYQPGQTLPPMPAPSAPVPTPTATLPRASVPASALPLAVSPSSAPAVATLSGIAPAPALVPMIPPGSPSMRAPMAPIGSEPTPAPMAPIGASAKVAPPPVPSSALPTPTKVASAEAPERPRPSTPPLVDPHPTRPLPKRFFRGRPVP